jgi:hypothetical protein
MKTPIKKYLAVMLATLALISQPVFGQVIFGGSDCGQWISSKTDIRKSWLVGFVSGLNTVGVAIGDKDWLAKVDSAEQIFLFVDNYCQKNPLKRIESAGQALMFELTKK